MFSWIFCARPDGFNGDDVGTFEQKNNGVLHFGEGLGNVYPVCVLFMIAFHDDDALRRVSCGNGEIHHKDLGGETRGNGFNGLAG